MEKVDNEYIQPVSEIRKVEGEVYHCKDEQGTEDQDIDELE